MAGRAHVPLWHRILTHGSSCIITVVTLGNNITDLDRRNRVAQLLELRINAPRHLGALVSGCGEVDPKCTIPTISTDIVSSICAGARLGEKDAELSGLFELPGW